MNEIYFCIGPVGELLFTVPALGESQMRQHRATAPEMVRNEVHTALIRLAVLGTFPKGEGFVPAAHFFAAS